MLCLRTRSGSPFLSFLSIKPHRTATDDAAAAAAKKSVVTTALFFSGLPLNWDKAAVEAVFACFGNVTNVVLHQNKLSGIVAFNADDKGMKAVKAALSAAASRDIVEWSLPHSEEPTGVKAWVQEHKALRPGNKVLQKQLDDWVENFEEEEGRRGRDKKASMADDGWTVVVRSKGRAKISEEGGMVTKGGGVATAAAKEVQNRKRANKASEDNFYSFQARDKRRNELMDLRKQFDDDKRRIADLRHSRNFKPY